MSHRVHLDWGVSGAHHLSPDVDVAVVVDVLSFTTTLGVACERGITVLPYQYEYDTARAFAEDNAAALAGRRNQPDSTSITLSPASIRRAVDIPQRLVLPSPNGSTISHLLSDGGQCVVAASLRNAEAVAAHLVERHPGRHIAVIAAGERWGDGSLRPAVEDFWGAGAVLDALVARGESDLSPEAFAAVHAWRAAASTVTATLADTVSGRELEAMGHAEDVGIAAEVGASTTVPVLDGGAYTPAS